jgi:hypothetical protein
VQDTFSPPTRHLPVRPNSISWSIKRVTCAPRSTTARLRLADDETMHDYRDVTPLSWGEQFHDQSFVSRPAMRLIAERGGRL